MAGERLVDMVFPSKQLTSYPGEYARGFNLNRMTRRERIFNKYGGKCAYSGTDLEPDWQIDHIQPLVRGFDGRPHSVIGGKDIEENMVPTQKIINHYKGSLPLGQFREWYLGGLHLRIGKPKNPITEKSRKRKEYLQKVADYFGITPDKPFDGKFYFETILMRTPLVLLTILPFLYSCTGMEAKFVCTCEQQIKVQEFVAQSISPSNNMSDEEMEHVIRELWETGVKMNCGQRALPTDHGWIDWSKAKLDSCETAFDGIY